MGLAFSSLIGSSLRARSRRFSPSQTILRRWRAGALPGYRLASNVLVPRVELECHEADSLPPRKRPKPQPRLATAEGEGFEPSIAELVFFLASHEAGYITGASIDINGGDLLV